IEIQLLDGEVEELDEATWNELELELVDEPDEWRGELDTMDDEDFDYDEDEDEDDDWGDYDDRDCAPTRPSAARLRESPRPRRGTSARDHGPLSARLLHVPQVRLQRPPALRELLFRCLVRDARRDDHVLAVLPVHRRRDLMLRRQLDRVEQTQHLVEVA